LNHHIRQLSPRLWNAANGIASRLACFQRLMF
jgi:hypothetical protein